MKIVVIHSGGLDSSVLLYHLMDAGHELLALNVDYAQRHKRELACAEKLCKTAGLRRSLLKLGNLGELLEGNALTDPRCEVPKGAYAEFNMRQTVVPGRNLLFIAAAGCWAMRLGCDAVAYGAHSGDSAVYPDCRAEFIAATAQVLRLGHYEPIELLCPFVNDSKAKIVARGAELNVPMEQTWSCYVGGKQHCGQCPACIERHEAFRLAKVEDKTLYEQTPLTPTQSPKAPHVRK